jgi:serine/threonine protein kinase
MRVKLRLSPQFARYSFGAVLYEVLTGQPPYTRTSREEVIQAILAGPPRPVLKLNRKADPRLVAIVEGAMARALHERYAHISYVLEDLERVAQGHEPLGPGRRPMLARLRPLRKLM